MRRVTQRDAAMLPPSYKGYANRFVEVCRDLRRTMEGFGLPIEAVDAQAIESLRERLRDAGARFRNDGKSIVLGPLSAACERCRTGERSVSQFVSLACPRSCWFCFNANQFDYEQYRSCRKNWREEMDAHRKHMGTLDYVALTGGEPLLYPDEACAFFAYAKQLNPKVHCRLYTSGWGVNEALLARLAESGLDEIRFSIKLDDAYETEMASSALLDEPLGAQLERVASAVGVINAVMVEMPVIPGTQAQMRTILRELDRMGAFGINLLEFCFPLHNAHVYAARGFSLAADPYRIPYDYGYAGALPVAGSEQEALELAVWAAQQNLRIGIHYCSLENKNTAQIFAQNHAGAFDIAPYRFSQRDFFYKVLRGFGPDALRLIDALQKTGAPFEGDACALPGSAMVAFDPVWLARLDARVVDSVVERGMLLCASAVVEPTDDGKERFREVGLCVVEPEDVDLARSGELVGRGDVWV